MLRPWPIEDESTFTADIPDRQLYTPLAIKYLKMSISGELTAGAAKTPSELLALITNFELKHGPDAKIRLSGWELYAMNRLYLKHEPRSFLPDATTDEMVAVMDMRIPVNLPAGHGPDYWNIDYTAVSGIDTTLLSLWKIQTEAALMDRPLKVLPFDITPSAANVFNKALEYSPEGDIEAIMFKMTTPPDETDAAAGIQELRVDIDGIEKAKENIQVLCSDFFYSAKKNDAETRYVQELYGIWDFREEPIPAASKFALYVLPETAEALRFYPIERLK